MRLNRVNTILPKLNRSDCQKEGGIHNAFVDVVNLEKVSTSPFEDKDENAILMGSEG